MKRTLVIFLSFLFLTIVSVGGMVYYKSYLMESETKELIESKPVISTELFNKMDGLSAQYELRFISNDFFVPMVMDANDTTLAVVSKDVSNNDNRIIMNTFISGLTSAGLIDFAYIFDFNDKVVADVIQEKDYTNVIIFVYKGKLKSYYNVNVVDDNELKDFAKFIKDVKADLTNP